MVLGEQCRKSRVLRQCDDTRVVGVAVAPHGKVVAVVGRGTDGAFREVIVDTCTAHGTVDGGVDRQRYAVLVVVELCREDAVAGHLHQSRIGGIAVAPLREVVAVVGGGGKGCGVEVFQGASATSVAFHRVSRQGGNVVGILCKQRGKSRVLRQRDGTWIVGVAVAPLCEAVAIVGGGSNGTLREVVVAAFAAHAAVDGSVHCQCYAILVVVELCRENAVLCYLHQSRIGGVTIAPLRKVIAIVSNGNESYRIAIMDGITTIDYSSIRIV